MSVGTAVPEDLVAARTLAVARGHTHRFDRALSRRKFLAGTAGTIGALSMMSVVGAERAFALTPSGAGAPTPIPNGIQIGGQLFHLYLAGPPDNPAGTLSSPGGEQASIFNFNGVVASTEITGQGTGMNPDGSKPTLFYDVDVRAMRGEYIDRNGRHGNATFGFV